MNEPTVAQTITMLRGLKSKYELHHGISISDSAIVAAATLSERYIADRFLPDKAIDCESGFLPSLHLPCSKNLMN